MRVVLADDHPLFLDGLKNLITSRGLEVVGTACDGWEALDRARSLNPDLVLMDVQMPRLDGLAATRLIKAEMPRIKVVMLTMDDRNESLFEAIKSGASGYLLKTENTDVFFQSLLAMAEGQAPLSAGLAARILKEFAEHPDDTRKVAPEDGLSTRQRQVLAMVASGMTYKEVGAKLNLSERTIKYHMGEIVQRLHLENRSQVIEYAQRIPLA
jgi:two-component system NarL family response regulator